MLLPALVLLLTSRGVEVPQSQPPRFEDEIRAFEAADKAKMPEPWRVLFLGSSSIRLWKTLEADFPGYRVHNRGFGGSRIDDSVRLIDRVVTPYKPSAVVFFAGTNDLQDGHSPERVAAGYAELVKGIRSRFPEVPIAYIAITPAPSRWALYGKMRDANARIRQFSSNTPNLWFIDTVPSMLNVDGGPRPELFVEDQLHMNEHGYAIWKKVVGATLRRMLPPNAK